MIALRDALDISILAEDDDILAVSKPAGLVVHPAYRHLDGTLTDAIFARADRCGVPRPWLLHRLDRETSGVVLFARTEEARRNLVRQFEQRRIVKRYLAIIVGGCLATSSGEIDAPLCRDPLDRRRVIVSPAGKSARTRYQVLAVQNGFSLVIAQPLTGRTHQIRAHLAFKDTPIAGDLAYGGATEATQTAGIERAQLHAWELVFRHPATGASTTVRAPIPADMRAACATLGLDSELLSELSRPPCGESD